MAFGLGFDVDPLVDPLVEPPEDEVGAGLVVADAEEDTTETGPVRQVLTSAARAGSLSATSTVPVARASRVTRAVLASSTEPEAVSRYSSTSKVALRSSREVTLTVETGGVAPAQDTTTAVAGSPVGLADGVVLAELPPLPLPLCVFFLLLLELEQPPPLLLLFPLFPLLPLPPVDEKPVSAKTTAMSTAVNRKRRTATMAPPLPLDNSGSR
ncbi:hypothetical protein [Streptomyces sp. NPDC058701]|uniref:hypothetical protein n=1 Tax=Streptomyces sp. NPDC058701 TaxID=3346608 RepID=UPI003661E513